MVVLRLTWHMGCASVLLYVKHLLCTNSSSCLILAFSFSPTHIPTSLLPGDQCNIFPGICHLPPALQPLPDLSQWTYAGTGRLPGKASTYIWELTERWWDKV